MTVTLYETDLSYIVTVRAFNIEKNISYLFQYLDTNEAHKMANSFAVKLQKMGDLSEKTVKEIFREERDKLEDVFVDHGKGIADISTRANCYAVYYEYVDGPSPIMRMAFGKNEFGVNRAYRLAKEFNKKYYLLKKKKNLRDRDIEKLIGEYDKIKLKNKYNNLAKKRKKTLKKFRCS